MSRRPWLSILVLALLPFGSACGEAGDIGSRLHAGASVVSEAEEADLRAVALREGISYEEAVWRFGWQDDLGRVLARISQDYPNDYTSSAFRDDRSAVVRFLGGVPRKAQALLDEFSEAYDVKIVVETGSGYNQKALEEAVPRVHYALFCAEGVDNARTAPDEGVIRLTVQLSVDAPDSLMDDLRHIAQAALKSGAHQGMSVVVREWPRWRGSMGGYPEPDPDDPKGSVCDD